MHIRVYPDSAGVSVVADGKTTPRSLSPPLCLLWRKLGCLAVNGVQRVWGIINERLVARRCDCRPSCLNISVEPWVPGWRRCGRVRRNKCWLGSDQNSGLGMKLQERGAPGCVRCCKKLATQSCSLCLEHNVSVDQLECWTSFCWGPARHHQLTQNSSRNCWWKMSG